MIWNRAFQMPLGAGNLIYISAGVFLSETKISKKQRVAIYLCGAFALATHIFGTQVLSFRHNEIDRTFKGYENAPCIAYSCAIFVAAKYANFGAFQKLVAKAVDFFRPATFGVYLIHIFILDFAYKLPFVERRSFAFRFFGGIIIFAVSAMVVKILQKIPILKRFVPK